MSRPGGSAGDSAGASGQAPRAGFRSTSSPPEEVSVDALPPDFVAPLTALFGQCSQRLLRGRYGVTAFEWVGEEKPSGSKRRVCVWSHGLGQCYATADWELPQTLVEGGYAVLAYSFYGHGWSYAGDEVMGGGGRCCSRLVNYGTEVHLTQVKELLTHVMEPGEQIDLWVGHSTGGVVGPLVAAENVWPIRTFGLVNPAFWAQKPCFATLAEKWTCLSGLITNSPSLLKSIVESQYLAGYPFAFARLCSMEHLYPEKAKVAEENLKRNFAGHPQVGKVIAAISLFFLAGHMLPTYREKFKALTQRADGPEKIVIVWGKGDVVVPFRFHTEVEAWNPERIKIVTPLLGHECIFEDPRGVAQYIVDGLNKSD